jgi:hypothetical protein
LLLFAKRFFAPFKHVKKLCSDSRVFESAGHVRNLSMAVSTCKHNLFCVTIYNHIPVIGHDYDLAMALCLS